MIFNQYPYLNINDLNLDYILKHLKEFMLLVKDMVEWREKHEKEYDELKAIVDNINNGNFSPEFVSSLVRWYEDNIIDIIGEFVKQVFFGITDDGYFVAYIPESWSDITFGTSGLDDFPEGVEYGHLTLSY